MQVGLLGNVLHKGKQQQNKGIFVSSDAWQHLNLILDSKITDGQTLTCLMVQSGQHL